MPANSVTERPTRTPVQRLRTMAFAQVLTLQLQFLLGMANTFWLEVPESGPGWREASPGWLLWSHVALGLVLVVHSVLALIHALRSRDRSWLVVAAAGLVGIAIAFVGGSDFMQETSDDVSSFVMSLGYAVATSAYAAGLARGAATPS